MLYALDRFNQYAVKENLSAGAILLWQRLYFIMQRRGQFADVLQSTSVLMAMLCVSRQGLQQMRQALVDKGFLAIRQDEHQQIFYTLMLNGVEVLAPKNVSTQADIQNEPQPLSDAAKQAMQEPLAQKCAPVSELIANYGANNIQKSNDVGAADLLPPIVSKDTTNNYDVLQHCPSGNGAQWSALPTMETNIENYPKGDIILTNRYGKYIDAFCKKFGPAARADLMQWAEMRRKNGWTLTLWGLDVMLKKLIDLANGDAMQMGRIVAQSIKRRWKGFYELKVQAKPSGIKLLKLEEKEQKARERSSGYGKAAPAQKFAPEGRDLSFLER